MLFSSLKSFLWQIPQNFRMGASMANSKFEYVRNFESEEHLLPNCWIVVRVDGKNFHNFSSVHKFEKPNDRRSLNLMNRAACLVMEHYKDILLAYGQSDEYSFVFRKDTQLYNRRKTKIMTYVNSLFTSSFVFYWKDFFGHACPLKYPPSFDSRAVLYPSDQNLKDYLSWRQADCHINNLYNTTFWSLVLKGGLTNAEAETRLRGTLSSDKNEILFSEFETNYNNEPVLFKKGTTLLRKRVKRPTDGKLKEVVLPLHQDMIQESFWTENSEILDIKTSGFYSWPEGMPLSDLILQQLRCKNADSKETLID